MGPRYLQSEIHSDYDTESSIWSNYRSQIKSLYDASTSKEDFNDHLIREFNRKVNRLNLSTGLYIAPFDGGFRFIGNSIVSAIGSDDPANAAEPDATAWVLMDGPWYNTPNDPESGFIGGQSWRKMAPIGYFPYGNETYVYGDEVVRYETGVWIYENATLGEIARAYSYEPYPWLATTWNNGFTAAKVTSTYVKTTNYPAVP